MGFCRVARTRLINTQKRGAAHPPAHCSFAAPLGNIIIEQIREKILVWENPLKGTVWQDWICMRVVSLKSPLKGHQPLYVFYFLFLILNI